jgi:hypothetical protein
MSDPISTSGPGAGDNAAGAVPTPLFRTLRADPGHAVEWLMVFAVERLADESREYARRLRAATPGSDRAVLGERIRTQATWICRTDGALSGTPFLFALIPGYVAMLWEQARMTLRIAALYDRDLGDHRLPAEMLVLRGVYPSVDAAEAALASIRNPSSSRPDGRRAWPVRLFELGRRVLVLAGFLGGTFADEEERRRPWWRSALAVVIGAIIWALTWIFPVTFMILMAYSCATSTRSLGRRALAFFGGRPADAYLVDEADDPPRRRRLRNAALAASVVVPLGLIALTIRWHPGGVSWWRVLAALLGLSVTVVLFVLSSRRLPGMAGWRASRGRAAS